MKFLNKRYLKEIKFQNFELVKKELEEYKFNGVIDFTISPAFMMDNNQTMVLEGNSLVFIDGEIKKIEEINYTQVSDVQFNRNFTLQDFFDKNKDAKIIVFYTPGGNSVFHEGNKIRCFIKI